MKLFSYVLRLDDGAAPNPFWEYCTLVICKPVIRRTAKKGDWVIGTGSKNGRKNGQPADLEDTLVYAMKITEVKSLAKYDVWCKKNAPGKIPDMTSSDNRRRAGDSIYDFPVGAEPVKRECVYSGFPSENDLSGKNALISDHFYYFGEKPVPIPEKFLELVKRNQGHKKILDDDLINRFIAWLEKKYKKNKLYAGPQMPVSDSKKELRACVWRCCTDELCADETIVS
jgi:hypothetical protein